MWAATNTDTKREASNSIRNKTSNETSKNTTGVSVRTIDNLVWVAVIDATEAAIREATQDAIGDIL